LPTNASVFEYKVPGDHILLNTARNFLAGAKLTRKVHINLVLKQDLKILLASFECGRALATAGYGFAKDAFSFLPFGSGLSGLGLKPLKHSIKEIRGRVRLLYGNVYTSGGPGRTG